MIRKIFNKTIPVSDGIKKLGKQIIDNPMDWIQGRYCFTNKKNPDVEIWTCNGKRYIKIGGFNGLSYYEKIYINNCIKMSIANRLGEEIKTNKKLKK